MKLLNKKTLSGATVMAMLLTSPVYAQLSTGLGATQGAADTGAGTIDSVVQNVINILLFIVGAGSVIMLIIGGIQYITSTGDQQRVANAKNTIIYAVVGVIVAILAYALVNYVINDVFGAGG